MISALRGTLLAPQHPREGNDAAAPAKAAASPVAMARLAACVSPHLTPPTELLLSDGGSDEEMSPTPARTDRPLRHAVIDLTMDSPTELEDGLPVDLCSVIDLVSSDEDDDPSGPGLPRPTALHPQAASPAPRAFLRAAAASDLTGDADPLAVELPPARAESGSVKPSGQGPSRRLSHGAASPRFLVCAPSNVACDHLVSLLLGLPSEEQRADELEAQLLPLDSEGGRRLTLPQRWRGPEVSPGGLLGPDGLPWRPSVVRVGAGSLTAGRQELVQASCMWGGWGGGGR